MADPTPFPDYEKLGLFYLGKKVDAATRQPTSDLLLYDSRDLTTHGVCVGMTGSGKTGLCLSVLEEAAIDGIPVLAIDPKGDVGNLMLTFPNLKPEDFRPWVDEAEAQRQSLTADAFAANQADTWHSGLAKWGQDGARIARLRQAAEVVIYTPGSSSGIPISILASFSAPSAEVLEDEDLYRDRITTVATSLLSMMGRSADPVQSREHILLSRLFDEAWKQGRDLDLAAIIRGIQEPPFERLGVLDLESFFPSKDRFELAMALNNLLASPGFAPWLEGTPLDLSELLYTPEGKPRIAVVSIAHLSDAERMFFVTLLLSQAIAWMRKTSGTSSLRALLYMDEIFGYLPPIAEPPSKKPMLTLLKQARAFGFGVLLATQNPVDLDYKALSNMGTWFIGRLQTERDRDRLVDGLVGASGGGLDKDELTRLLGSLEKRMFLVQNAHRGRAELFMTRWALSYLAGPMTRQQIAKLMAPYKAGGAVPRPAVPTLAASPAPAQQAGGVGGRPVLPAEVPQAFLPPTGPVSAGLTYRPALLGLAKVHFTDPKLGVEHSEDVAYVTDFSDGVRAIDWLAARPVEVSADHLEREPASETALYVDPPDPARKAASYNGWSRDFADALFRNKRLALMRSPSLGLVSDPGETERDFRIRIQPLYRDERDRRLAEVEAAYAGKLERIEDQLARAEERRQRENADASERTWDTVLSVGSAIGSVLFGRGKILSSGTLGRASSAARGVGRIAKERQQAQLAADAVGRLQADRDALIADRHAEVLRVRETLGDASEKFEPLEVKPKKTDVRVAWVGLAWSPE
ncbi:MAG: ATP-binding protein [Thermoanaerobaculia bacterium]|nr:ATP-binding protein [Thermoanaerobaculia bacterium]